MYRVPFEGIKPTYGMLGGSIAIKLQGTFALQSFPFKTEANRERYVVDRWTPVSDRDKDWLNSFTDKYSGWEEVDAGGLWFGFEGEDWVEEHHVYQYHNLVVIRPKMYGLNISLESIWYKLSGGIA